MKFKFPT